MACIKKRRGKWVVDYRDALGRRRREVIKGNRKAANKKLGEILRRGGLIVEDSKRTFKEHAEEWLKTYAETHLKESTYREYEAALKNHLYPSLGAVPLARVTRDAVKNLIAEKVRAGLARSTVRNITVPMREMYNHAIDDGVAFFNPAARVGRFNRSRGEDKKIDALSREELSNLLKSAAEKMPHHYPLLLCAARTGMREGELIGLKWGDIDFHGRFIEVRRNVSRGHATTPKSGKARRVDMSLQLTNTLDELLGKRKAEALKREMEKPPEARRKPEEVLANVMEDWVFVTPERIIKKKLVPGTQLDPNNVRKRVFYPCLDAAELRRVRFHDLRHSYASLLIQQGESLAYVRDQLGHHSIQIAVDTYGHLVPGGNRQAVDRLDDVFPRAEEARNNESDEVVAAKVADSEKSGHKMVTSRLDRRADDA